MNNTEKRQSKTNARLAVVQALYEKETGGLTFEEILASFLSGTMGGEVLQEEDTGREKVIKIPDFDKETFKRLFEYSVSNQEMIDGMISDNLDTEHWSMDRMENVLKAILEAGISEIYVNRDTDKPIIISEYIDIADSFYPGGPERGLVNAVLDKIAKILDDNL